MARQWFTKTQDSLRGVSSQALFFMRAEFDGTVEDLAIRLSPGAHGTLVFNLRINGVVKFFGGDVPSMSPGTATVTKNDLGFEVNAGDAIQVDLVSNNGGPFAFPAQFSISIDDGTTGGASEEEIKEIAQDAFVAGANVTLTAGSGGNTGKIVIAASGDGGGGGGGFEKFAPLIICNGESNAGGWVPTEDASGAELDPKPEVQILNNDSLVFQDLELGVNNLLGHAELTDNTRFGWELALANSVANGDWSVDQVYLVKTAQGGSTIDEWDVDGDYWPLFVERVDAALQLLRTAGKIPVVYVWYSHGINDAVDGTPVNEWKEAVLAHFEKMRDKLGFCPILITELMSDYDDFNEAIDDLALASDFNIKIETSDATLENSNHWDKAGQALIAGRMKDICIGAATGEQPYYGANQAKAMYRLFRELGGDSPTDPDTFFDDFNDNSFDTAKWTKTESGATISETGGQLHFVYAGASGNSFIESVNAYNFVGKRVSVEFIDPKMDTANVDQELLLSPDSGLTGGYWMMTLTNGNVRCFINSGLVYDEPYDSDVHKFGQLRFTGSNLVFETSVNGIDWAIMHSEANTGTITALKVFLRAYVATSQTFTMKWDNLRSNV